MKKILALMLILALCFALVAFTVSCNEPEIDDETGDNRGDSDDGDNGDDGDGDNGGDEGDESGSANNNVGPWLPID